MPELAEQLAVYLVADPEQTSRDLLEDVGAALVGGVTAVQLRAKQLTDRQVFDLATRLGQLCRVHDALFLINDRVDIAQAVRADGVHLGVDDLPVSEARRLLGPEAVVGYSPDTDDGTERARSEGASYLGVGPVFGTASKLDAGAAIGVDTLRRRIGLAGIPVIGIGGITALNAGEVIAAGAVGVAVISAVLRAEDPSLAAAGVVTAVRTAKGQRP